MSGDNAADSSLDINEEVRIKIDGEEIAEAEALGGVKADNDPEEEAPEDNVRSYPEDQRDNIDDEQKLITSGGSLSPKAGDRKIGFSIARIMGFERQSANEVGVQAAADSSVTPSNSEKTSTALTVWRPQPLSRSRSGHSGSDNNGDQQPQAPSSAAASFFRQYSLLGAAAAGQQWKSSFISSYNSVFTAAAAAAAVAAASSKSNGSSDDAAPSATLSTEADDEKVTPAAGVKQKTYPCPECGKVFNAHYNLTRHMPVHTGNTAVNISDQIALRRYESYFRRSPICL